MTTRILNRRLAALAGQDVTQRDEAEAVRAATLRRAWVDISAALPSLGGVWPGVSDDRVMAWARRCLEGTATSEEMELWRHVSVPADAPAERFSAAEYLAGVARFLDWI